jgi:hypothetical protein
MEQRDKQRQGQQQIPFGNDKQRLEQATARAGTGNSKGSSRFPSGMTSKGWNKQRQRLEQATARAAADSLRE